MIYSLNGTLIHKAAGLAVIECGGVGMQCLVSMRTLSRLGQVGEPAFLYTYLNVREDALELCGFSEQNELNCFRMLLGVTGVGLKVALGILSDLTPERFAVCIASGDVASLKKCSGVGPKLAQRIILELKDKITKGTLPGDDMAGAVAEAVGEGPVAEAIDALAVLGYSKTDAAGALAGASPEAKVEELIKLGLKKLATKL